MADDAEVERILCENDADLGALRGRLSCIRRVLAEPTGHYGVVVRGVVQGMAVDDRCGLNT